MPLPLQGLRVSLLGAGRVGQSLAGWLRASGAVLTTVAFRRARDLDLAASLGARPTLAAELVSRDDDLLLIAVRDDALDGLVAGLTQRPQAAVVLHTSGSRGESVLAPLRRATTGAQRGCAVGSLHPLKAFPRPLPDPLEARGVLLAFAGDAAAANLASRLANAWDARIFAVPESARLLYHFGATLAAGGVATLLAAAAELARRAGLAEEVREGYLALARGTLTEVAAAAEPAAAITGPVPRGDGALVLRELEAVRETAPELHAMACLLARTTLDILARADRRSSSQDALDQQLATICRSRGFLDPPGGG